LPGIFPNVRAAEDGAEQVELERRYQDALKSASARNCLPELLTFQAAVAQATAVVARPLGEVQRLATSDKQGYATHYNLIESEVKIPDNDRWEPLRRAADALLFTGYEKKIRFAALSLDGAGLPHYGECSLSARDVAIAHRASLFEENSAAFIEQRGMSAAREAGHRGTWADRGKLAATKLGSQVSAATTANQFQELLLRAGAKPEDDRFIEVNVWGPMTIRSFEGLVITRKKRQPSPAIVKALTERLKSYNVTLEVR